MRRKYYLIDTENVGDKWFGLLDKIHKKDRIVTFYSENHSKRLREFLLRQVNNSQIIWLECAVGNNAMDYQLVGVLAYLIVKHPKASFCIYSNDKGYQKTIDFWESRGIQIHLKGTNQKKKAKKKEKKKHREVKKEPVLTVLDSLPSVQPERTEERYIKEIAKSVPLSNMNGWYCALTVVLGQADGRSWYQRLKNNAQMCEELSGYYVEDLHTRGVHLTELVLQINGLDTVQAEQAYQIIQSHDPKDLNAIKMDFDKMAGQSVEEKNKYYKVLRPVVALLHNL